MNESSAKMRGIARRLIAHDRKVNPSSAPRHPWVFCEVCEKLRLPLSALAGVGGFRALLGRALMLANSEILWLRGVHVNSDGMLQFPEELARLHRGELSKGEVILIAHLLVLLMSFIGEAMTFNL